MPAILKLADRNFQSLPKLTETAIQDYRDVLSWAEYPRWSEEIGFEEASRKLEQEVIKSDWRQYCQWLGREAEPGASLAAENVYGLTGKFLDGASELDRSPSENNSLR